MSNRFYIFLFLLAALSCDIHAQDRRLLPLGGTITEIVYALGAGEQVIATGITSTYPKEAAALPKVGFMRSLTAEGIIAQRADLILTTDAAGPPETMAQLAAAGLDMVIYSHPPTVEGTKELIGKIGDKLGRKKEARKLSRKIDSDLAELKTLLSQTRSKPRVLFVYARGAGTLMVGGTGTAADAMIRLAGGENVITFEGFKPLTSEAVVSANPDVILMLDKGLESVGGVEGALKLPGLSLTKAGKTRKIVSLDDLYLIGFGPRVGQAAIDLAKLLHPELR